MSVDDALKFVISMGVVTPGVSPSSARRLPPTAARGKA
jgi:uncharacterized membrane protein